MLTYREAKREAMLRFPHQPSRQRDFLASWKGLWERRHHGREKYQNRFGRKTQMRTRAVQ